MVEDVHYKDKKVNDAQFCVLQAMTALLCCGPWFDDTNTSDDRIYYKWLDMMLESHEDRVNN